jgi:hypothetical protein
MVLFLYYTALFLILLCDLNVNISQYFLIFLIEPWAPVAVISCVIRGLGYRPLVVFSIQLRGLLLIYSYKVTYFA